MFRLHLDIPLVTDEKLAMELTNLILNNIKDTTGQQWFQDSKLEINYRLGNDNDRCIRNYLITNENGHATTKKCKL